LPIFIRIVNDQAQDAEQHQKGGEYLRGKQKVAPLFIPDQFDKMPYHDFNISK
jgi:hypothetical protein